MIELKHQANLLLMQMDVISSFSFTIPRPMMYVGFSRKRCGVNRLGSIFVNISPDYCGIEQFAIAFEKPLHK